jgi:monoamine oxidase
MEELESALQQLRHDTPLRDFLEEHFPGTKNKKFRQSVINYAQGYDAADASDFSTMAFKNELQNEDEDNYRLNNGYTSLMQHTWMQCEAHGTVLRLNTIVKQIDWTNKTINVITSDADVYKAKQVIVTTSLGIWQSRKGSKGHINFVPDLPVKSNAARQLGFGAVIKIVLQFNEVFWKDKADKIGFIISNETIPTWWTQQPDKHPMLSGWVAGPQAENMKALSEEDILKKAINSLSKIFGVTTAVIKKKLVAAYVFNWIKDPFVRGAYSYQVVNATTFKNILAQPVNNKLFFAGEALSNGNEMGTVEAALASGDYVAKQVLARGAVIE